MTQELLNTSVNDIINLVLVGLGVLFSLFTLLYSFIFSKKEQLDILDEGVNKGCNNILIKQRHKEAISYIKKIRVITNQMLVLIAFLSIVLSLNIVIKYFIDELSKQILLFKIDLILLSLLFVFAIVSIVRILKKYFKTIRL